MFTVHLAVRGVPRRGCPDVDDLKAIPTDFALAGIFVKVDEAKSVARSLVAIAHGTGQFGGTISEGEAGADWNAGDGESTLEVYGYDKDDEVAVFAAVVEVTAREAGALKRRANSSDSRPPEGIADADRAEFQAGWEG
jgi:hypothetical protein